MSRLIASFALLFAVGTVSADIAPPKGIKRIPYEARILIEKEITGYVFYAVSGDKATAVKLDVKTPATIKAGGGRYRSAELVAVPDDAAKKFPSEKDFEAAVAKGKVDGLVHSKKFFNAFMEVKDADTRKSVVEEFKLVKVDAKGITLEAVKPAKETPKNTSEEETEEMSAAPKNGSMVSGIAAFLGVALAGLWIVRRWK